MINFQKVKHMQEWVVGFGLKIASCWGEWLYAMKVWRAICVVVVAVFIAVAS